MAMKYDYHVSDRPPDHFHTPTIHSYTTCIYLFSRFTLYYLLIPATPLRFPPTLHPVAPFRPPIEGVHFQ